MSDMDARCEEEIITVIHNLLLNTDDFFDGNYFIEDWINAIKVAAREIQDIEDRYANPSRI